MVRGGKRKQGGRGVVTGTIVLASSLKGNRRGEARASARKPPSLSPAQGKQTHIAYIKKIKGWEGSVSGIFRRQESTGQRRKEAGGGVGWSKAAVPRTTAAIRAAGQSGENREKQRPRQGPAAAAGE